MTFGDHIKKPLGTPLEAKRPQEQQTSIRWTRQVAHDQSQTELDGAAISDKHNNS